MEDMKLLHEKLINLFVVTLLLIFFVWITFYSFSEDNSYKDFSPLEGKTIADQVMSEFNESAKLITVQKYESYAYRYEGNGEWAWNYYYVNLSNNFDHTYYVNSSKSLEHNYSIVTLYQNHTTSINWYNGDFNRHLSGLNHMYSTNLGIENWTIDCDEALNIIKSNEEFAEFYKNSPGLNIVEMQLTSPDPDGYYRYTNPIWYIYFEGRYDDGMDNMYGTYGEARIDATTGEVLWVNVNGEWHPPPCCGVLIIILSIIEIYVLVRTYKHYKIDKHMTNTRANHRPEQGADEAEEPAEEQQYD